MPLQIDARSGGATVRVRGDVPGAILTAAAKSAGFELHRESSYVASGSSSETEYKRLHEVLSRVEGVKEIEINGVVGGAALRIIGEIEEDALVASARSAGYGLRPLGGAGSGSRPSTTPPATETSDVERTTPPAPTGERDADDVAKIGSIAPDFTLTTQDGKGTIRLSDYRGKKPVVLVFGSYTCPPFRQRVVLVDEIYKRYKDRVTFLFVYIREAHPESILLVPTKEGGKRLEVVSQTTTAAERLKNLEHCVSRLQLTIPALIDGDDNAVKHAYAAWPIRLYGIGTDGIIAYKSGPGPGGFRPPDLEDWLHTIVK